MGGPTRRYEGPAGPDDLFERLAHDCIVVSGLQKEVLVHHCVDAAREAGLATDLVDELRNAIVASIDRYIEHCRVAVPHFVGDADDVAACVDDNDDEDNDDDVQESSDIDDLELAAWRQHCEAKLHYHLSRVLKWQMRLDVIATEEGRRERAATLHRLSRVD